MTTYRTGTDQPRNLYRGNEYIGVCFDPADTALIVDALEGRTYDGDAPSAPAISPQAAQNASGVVGSGSGDPNALETAFPARYWGERPAHPTCIDITTIDQRPGSAWMCGPECPKEA